MALAVFDKEGIITNQLTTGVHRRNALKIASPNKLSSRELDCLANPHDKAYLAVG